MKKIPLGSIAIALFIGGFYTFTFCMVGDVHTSDTDLEPYIMTTEPVVEPLCLTMREEGITVSGTNAVTTVNEASISKNDAKGEISANANEITLPEKATTKPVVTTKITTAPPPVTTVAQTVATTVTTTATVAVTSPKDDLPSKDINSNDTVSYTLNGEKFTTNAYDAVCKIVSAEMPVEFETEAIKAQAVATYSYLKFNNAKGISPSVSAKNNVPTKISNAVKSVYGQAVYYNGKYAQTVYSSATGGYTASAKDVWGKDVPYLQSVVSEFDACDKYFGRVEKFSKSEVRSKIENATGISLSNNPENWITFLDAANGGVCDGGYVGKLLIDGHSYYEKNGNKITITGRVLRESIFKFDLCSSKFDVKYSDETFTFTTFGYGHGVGMSQYGANFYAAKAGYSYIDILNHYYTGATIK